MLASGNDLQNEMFALKEHSSVMADIITNLNGYITQLRASALSDIHAYTQPAATNSHREQ